MEKVDEYLAKGHLTKSLTASRNTDDVHVSKCLPTPKMRGVGEGRAPRRHLVRRDRHVERGGVRQQCLLELIALLPVLMSFKYTKSSNAVYTRVLVSLDE